MTGEVLVSPGVTPIFRVSKLSAFWLTWLTSGPVPRTEVSSFSLGVTVSSFVSV